MMGELIYQILSPIFNTRVYPIIAPEGVIAPYAIYSIVYDSDRQSINTGAFSHDMRVQIDVYGATYQETDTKAEEVRQALYSSATFPYNLSMIDGFENNANIYRKIIDIKITGGR